MTFHSHILHAATVTLFLPAWWEELNARVSFWFSHSFQHIVYLSNEPYTANYNLVSTVNSSIMIKNTPQIQKRGLLFFYNWTCSWFSLCGYTRMLCMHVLFFLSFFLVSILYLLTKEKKKKEVSTWILLGLNHDHDVCIPKVGSLPIQGKVPSLSVVLWIPSHAYQSSQHGSNTSAATHSIVRPQLFP